MTEDYPTDWSEEDIAAKEADTPSWESSDTSMSKTDREKLASQLQRSDTESDIIGVPDSIDPDI